MPSIQFVTSFREKKLGDRRGKKVFEMRVHNTNTFQESKWFRRRNFHDELIVGTGLQ